MNTLDQFEIIPVGNQFGVRRIGDLKSIGVFVERRFARLFKESVEIIDPTSTVIMQKIEFRREEDRRVIERETEERRANELLEQVS